MALVGFKPRPRMRSWAAPEPPRPRRSRYLWIALLGWFGALYIGFRLVWPNASFENYSVSLDTPTAETDEITPAPPIDRELEPVQAATPTKPFVDETSQGSGTVPTRPNHGGELPGCEGFRNAEERSDSERMPAHLGNAAIGNFIDETAWLKPCRGRKRKTINFCAAIRDGALVGLSLHASPPDLTLENCVREQALKVPLRAEPSLRIVETRLTL